MPPTPPLTRPPHRSRSSLPRPWAGRSAPGPEHGRRLPGPRGAPRNVCSGAQWRCGGRSDLGRARKDCYLWLWQSSHQTRLGGGGAQRVEIGWRLQARATASFTPGQQWTFRQTFSDVASSMQEILHLLSTRRIWGSKGIRFVGSQMWEPSDSQEALTLGNNSMVVPQSFGLRV